MSSLHSYSSPPPSLLSSHPDSHPPSHPHENARRSVLSFEQEEPAKPEPTRSARFFNLFRSPHSRAHRRQSRLTAASLSPTRLLPRLSLAPIRSPPPSLLTSPLNKARAAPSLVAGYIHKRNRRFGYKKRFLAIDVDDGSMSYFTSDPRLEMGHDGSV